MRPLIISAIAFVLVLGGAMLGMYFRKVVSADHLRDDVKDVVRLSTGLIGTIAALVLGLLIASAKNSYDARSTQFKQITANVIFLDLLLEQYGSDAQNLRGMLRIGVPIIVERITNEGRSGKPAPFETTSEAQRFIARIQELKANTEAQHELQTRIISAAVQLAQSRLALFTQSHDSIPAPFLTNSYFLARRHIRKLRFVRATGAYRGCDVCGRSDVGLRRPVSHPGNGSAFCGPIPDTHRDAARRTCAAWQLNRHPRRSMRGTARSLAGS